MARLTRLGYASLIWGHVFLMDLSFQTVMLSRIAEFDHFIYYECNCIVLKNTSSDHSVVYLG
jgi:hypothetical protein